MEWQPMETADKSGAQVLLRLGRNSYVIGYYDVNYGFWRESWEDGNLKGISTTHWMPIPKLAEDK